MKHKDMEGFAAAGDMVHGHKNIPAGASTVIRY